MGRRMNKAESPASSQAMAPLVELGVSGLQRPTTRGLVYEEFLRELSPYRARRVYREMRDNDPTIGAMFWAIEGLIRNLDWRVDGKDEEANEFIESCMKDMSHTWEDLMCEILSMLAFGWSFHELVYKRRLGESQTDPTKRSKYNDGKIGWRKIPIRSQDSLADWIFDEDGGIQAFVQTAPPDYDEVTIPIQKALLFRTTSYKNSPEGRSILRNAYRPWWFKKRIEEIEGIGIERDLAGMPVIYAAPELLEKNRAAFETIVRNVHRDEQEGMLFPLVYDSDGNQLVKFELVTTGGNRQFNTTEIINRYDKRIAMVALADFILLGQDKVGSFALSSDKTTLFATALKGTVKSIASTFNEHGIPRLLQLNNMKPKERPYLVPGDFESEDLEVLGGFLSKIAAAGITFEDDDTQNHIRKLAGLPERKEPMPDDLSPMPQRGLPKGPVATPAEEDEVKDK